MKVIDYGIKLCATCGLVKPTIEFYRDKSRSDGLDRECRTCVLEISAKKRIENALNYNERNVPDEKICQSCRRVLSAPSFAKDKGQTDGLQRACRECKGARNRARYAEKSVEVRKYVNAIKEFSICADCGEDYPCHILEFDHIHGDKEYDISMMVKRTLPVEKIQAEIDKCEVVCANCHKDRTHIRRLGGEKTSFCYSPPTSELADRCNDSDIVVEESPATSGRATDS